MSFWGRSACYLYSNFYPLSDGPSTRHRRITKAKFCPRLMGGSCSQAHENLIVLFMLTRVICTFCSLIKWVQLSLPHFFFLCLAANLRELKQQESLIALFKYFLIYEIHCLDKVIKFIYLYFFVWVIKFDIYTLQKKLIYTYAYLINSNKGRNYVRKSTFASWGISFFLPQFLWRFRHNGKRFPSVQGRRFMRHTGKCCGVEAPLITAKGQCRASVLYWELSGSWPKLYIGGSVDFFLLTFIAGFLFLIDRETQKGCNFFEGHVESVEMRWRDEV